MARRLKILDQDLVNGHAASEITPRTDQARPSEAPVKPAPRLVKSPLQIDHRGEVIDELRQDAATLREQARMAIERAGQLEAAAQHLEEHPPEEIA